MICVDASTLILLAKTELLDEFISVNKAATIGQQVYDECVGKEPNKRTTFDAMLIEKRVAEGKISLRTVTGKEAVNEIMQTFNLEQGESETLALALEAKCKVVGLDDGKAIKAAKILKLEFITALTFVIQLEKLKRISKIRAKEIINKLQIIGRYSNSLIDCAIKEVGKNE